MTANEKDNQIKDAINKAKASVATLELTKAHYDNKIQFLLEEIKLLGKELKEGK